MWIIQCVFVYVFTPQRIDATETIYKWNTKITITRWLFHSNYWLLNDICDIKRDRFFFVYECATELKCGRWINFFFHFSHNMQKESILFRSGNSSSLFSQTFIKWMILCDCEHIELAVIRSARSTLTKRSSLFYTFILIFITAFNNMNAIFCVCSQFFFF